MNGPELNHSLGLADFIFNVGYLGQNWADIHISFFDTGIKAHRSKLQSQIAELIISRASSITLPSSSDHARPDWIIHTSLI